MSTKLRLMHLFRHMHHSSTLAHEVEARCTALLAVHTLRAPTVVLLESLTALAERVPGLAARHVARLWTVVTSDPRRVVQERALLCLARLAARPRGVFSVNVRLPAPYVCVVVMLVCVMCLSVCVYVCA